MAEYRRGSSFNGLVDLLGTAVTLASCLAALFLIVEILLVVFKASPTNEVARFFHYVAVPIAWIFKGLFTPKSTRLRVAVNYGLAAVVYLVAGRIVVRILKFVSPA